MDPDELVRSFQVSAQRFAPKPKAKASTAPGDPASDPDSPQSAEETPNAEATETPPRPEPVKMEPGVWYDFDWQVVNSDTGEVVELKGAKAVFSKSEADTVRALISDDPKERSFMMIATTGAQILVTRYFIPEKTGNRKFKFAFDGTVFF